MNNKLNVKAVVMVVGLGVLIVGFQNCSRVDFTSTDALTSKGAANGDTDQVTILIDEAQPEQEQASNEPQPEEQDVTAPDDTAMPQPEIPDVAKEEEQQPTTPDTQMPEPKKEDVVVNPMPEQPDTQQPETQQPVAPPISDEAKPFYAECESKRKKAALPLSAGASVENLSGSKSFSASSLNKVRELSGNQSFQQSGETVGSIELVEKVSGTTWICGFDVKSIKNISGNLIIVGGNIDSIDSKSGTVKLVGGTVGTITNSSGNFKYEEIH
jgi:hypothetical protein